MWTKRSKLRKSARDGSLGASYCKEHMREEGGWSSGAACAATRAVSLAGNFDELILNRDVAFS